MGSEEASLVQDSEVLSRLASVGQIAAGVAHEVRNPLTAVKGFLQILKEEHDFQHWDVVFSELNQAIATIESLLSVSKPSLQTEEASDFSLCVELENVLSLFQKDAYRIEFTKDWHDKSTKIRGKKNQVKKALFNLIKNSCEAIEDTGKVTVKHYRLDDYVHLVISDTGTGISEEHLSKLGVPFFTTKTSGVGMGLTQVYSTFYEHGARIDVHSRLGEGTTFEIALPISPIYRTSFEETIQRMSSLPLQPADEIRDFFRINQKIFNELLEEEARTTFEIVAKSKFVTTQDLLDHANQITELIHDGLTQDIIELA